MDDLESFCYREQQKEMLQLKDILKDNNQLKLSNSCNKTNKGNLNFNHSLEEANEHRCDNCSNYIRMSDFDGECKVLKTLLNKDDNVICYSSLVFYCEAYDKIQTLNIINSKDEMINFIKRTENYFGCPEDFEYYYGFNRNWDEETGEILETIDEYCLRGGEFENIPKEYPCVIYFNYNTRYPLEHIYLGEDYERK